MNPSVDIDESQVGKLSRRIFDALSDLRRQCVQDVWEALTDSVKIAVANFCELQAVRVTRLAVRDSSPKSPISPKNSPGLR